MPAPTLSVVVPCYNEQESIHACHEKLTEVLSALNESYEIVYVDDGSHDQTAALLDQMHACDPHVVVVRLSRNFGHQPAVTAGLSASLGQAVVIIDADLQDPPELIPEMVTLWRSGYKVVYGIRQTRDGETPFKLWTAKAFYRVINSLSDVDIPVDTGDFRLIDRVVVDVFLRMPERHRLLRGMWSWIGFPQVGLPYQRAPRFAGETKYPLRKMLGLALDGIVSFSVVPLRLVTALGISFGGRGVHRNCLHALGAPADTFLGARMGDQFCRHAVHGGRADALSRHSRRVHRAHLHGIQAATAVYPARNTAQR